MIRTIAFPGTVKEVRSRAFEKNQFLRAVVLNEGLKKLEGSCNRKYGGVFSDVHIRQIVLPSTLRVLGNYTFWGCKDLKVICVEDGCEASFFGTGIPSSAKISLPRKAVTLGKPLGELRELKEIIIPDEAKEIGSYWFWGSGVESVKIPCDIRKIGVEAFCNCKELKNIVFKKIKKDSVTSEPNILVHQYDEMERKVICTRAFCGCCSLKDI